MGTVRLVPQSALNWGGSHDTCVWQRPGAGWGEGEVVEERGLRCPDEGWRQSPLMGWGARLSPVIGPELP